MREQPTPHVLDVVEVDGSEEIRPADLKRRLDKDEDVLILDVRGPEEFEGWHIPGAVNIPLGDLQDGADLPARQGQVIVTVCAVGVRSAMAQQILRDRGYQAYNLHNGMMGWNRVFNAVEVDEVDLADGTHLLQIQRIGKGCLSYLIVSGDEALVVDPAHDWGIYTKLAQGYQAEVVAVVDTHAHADHVSGGPAMAAALEIPYHLHPYDAIHPIDMLPAEISYEPLNEGDQLTVGGSRLEVLHIPGHTLGNLALLLDDQALFTGDSVFLASIARPDLGGEAEAWTPLHHSSLNRILQLDPATTVLPGHFGDAEEARQGVFAETLGTLAASNDGLQRAQRPLEEFKAFILASLPSFPERYIDIKRVNAGLRHADGQGIRELEFGKQECAVSG